MKKRLLMAFAIVTISGMVAVPSMAQVKYAVSGTYTEDGKKVYLIDQLTEKAIDSVVVADGKFAFTGTADKDALMGVKAEQAQWTTPFFNDGTPIIINVNDSTLEAEIRAHQDELMGDMNKMIDSMIAFANKVFKEERNSLIPVAFSSYYFIDNGVEAYDELVKENVVFANHPFLKKTRDYVEAATKPKDSPKTAIIGQQFIDLEMADPDGNLHKLSELVGEGKYVLVDFWASWCGPCRAEMPNVLEAYNKYHAKGFEVIGVSFDQKKEAWIKAIGQLKMPWLQISDLKGWKCAAAPIYNIDGIPDNILIDPKGKVIDRALRGKALHNKLQKIFGE